MLSVLHPEVLSYFRDFNYGLMPIFITKENKFCLIVKATKEMILTAKINNQFKVYHIKDSMGDGFCLGLISAFFDDHDEPLTMTTPLFSGDEMLSYILSVFSQPEFEIYFFDENNYELLGVKGKNSEYLRFGKEISAALLSKHDPHTTLKHWEKMGAEFGRRTQNDDLTAFTIDCSERLYPDDIMIMDLRDKFYGYNDHEKNIATSSLERDGNPGPMQEKDIARFLLRVFDKKCLYLNPQRADTGKELVDVMVVTDKIIFFVQAKDSPNTKEMLQRDIKRKRITIRKHVQKASSQVKGALSYARESGGVTIITSNGTESISLDGKKLIGLIVVKELFDDDYKECSTPILKVVGDLGLPVGLFSYSQLNVLTQRLGTPALFIDGLHRALVVALEHKQFPKLVHSGTVPH